LYNEDIAFVPVFKGKGIQRIKKVKLSEVTGRGGLYGSEMLRISHRVDNRRTDGGKKKKLPRIDKGSGKTIFCS
jgi:hypothetical protein